MRIRDLFAILAAMALVVGCATLSDDIRKGGKVAAKVVGILADVPFEGTANVIAAGVDYGRDTASSIKGAVTGDE